MNLRYFIHRKKLSALAVPADHIANIEILISKGYKEVGKFDYDVMAETLNMRRLARNQKARNKTKHAKDIAAFHGVEYKPRKSRGKC